MDEEAEEIVDLIVKETDSDREAVLKEVEERQEELGNFITPEGAARLIARDRGVDSLHIPEPAGVRKLKVVDLSPGMAKVRIEGEAKWGLLLSDDTGEILVSVDDGAYLPEEIEEGDKIRVTGNIRKAVKLRLDSAEKVVKLLEI